MAWHGIDRYTADERREEEEDINYMAAWGDINLGVGEQQRNRVMQARRHRLNTLGNEGNLTIVK